MNTVDISPFRNQLDTIDWEFLQADLFGKDLPREKIWTGQKNILPVLKTIVARASNSHLLYTPDYEAEPLQAVKANWERFCLELTYSLTAVVSPKSCCITALQKTRGSTSST